MVSGVCGVCAVVIVDCLGGGLLVSLCCFYVVHISMSWCSVYLLGGLCTSGEPSDLDDGCT